MKLYIEKSESSLEPLGIVFRNMYLKCKDDIFGKVYRNVFDTWDIISDDKKNKDKFEVKEFKTKKEMNKYILDNEPIERYELRKPLDDKHVLDVPIGKINMLGY